jgi:osomolarity two-component system sensor histidine kinase SLN1
MDSGRFESVSRPYSFHQVIRGLFVPLRLATDARHLELVTDLDPCIDKVCSSSFPVAFEPTVSRLLP